MIHIKRSSKTKQYRVIYTGNNNEILSVSEPLKTKQSAWKNIFANWSANFMMDAVQILVQDDTLKEPAIFWYTFHKYKAVASRELRECNIEL